jgi:hypothetical protein
MGTFVGAETNNSTNSGGTPMKENLVLLCLGSMALFAIGCSDDSTQSATGDSDAGSAITGGDGEGPEIVPATPIAIESGCATYIGNHLKHPDGEHVQTYEFCADGTMTKFWDPVPAQDFPQAMTCPGTWSSDSRGGLQIAFECIDAGFPNSATEVYEVAYMYEDGAKLDMHEGKIQQEPGDGSSIVGTYANSISGVIDMADGLLMYMEMWGDHETVVTDGRWENVEHEFVTCEGTVCTADFNSEQDNETSGEFKGPGKLYDLGGVYVFQGTQYHVMDRQ